MAETKTDGKKCLGHVKGSRWRQDMIRQRAYLQEIGWGPGGETHHEWPSDLNNLNDFQPSTVICNTSNVAAPSAAHAVVQHLGPEPDLSFWDLEPEATDHCCFLLKQNEVRKHGQKTSWKTDSHISHVTRSSWNTLHRLPRLFRPAFSLIHRCLVVRQLGPTLNDCPAELLV